MRLAVVSDLHLEMRSEAKAIMRVLDKCKSDADVLVVAGDVVSGKFAKRILPEFMHALSCEYEHVIYVPGNHEYWHSNFFQIDILLYDIEQRNILNGFYVFRNEQDEGLILGPRVYGGTLWFPRSVLSEAIGPQWADFHYIGNEDCQYACNHVKERIYLEAARFRANFPKEVDIVVSHHLPSYKSVAPYWKNNDTNCYFVNDCEDLIVQAKPKLWIHGHTHSKCDYEFEGCRIVCNPLGAPSERSSKTYRPLIVEV